MRSGPLNPFRMGGSAAKVFRLELWQPDRRPHGEHLPRHIQNELRKFRAPNGEIGQPLEEVRLPPKLRPRTQMVTACFLEGTWLVGRTRQAPDGSYYTPVARRDPDGYPTSDLHLPHDVYLVESPPHDNVVVTVTRELEVRAYSFSGDVVFSADLGASPDVQGLLPEIQATVGRVEGEIPLRYVLRAVVVSPSLDRIVFSVLDRIFSCSLDGRVHFAVRMPPQPHSWWGMVDYLPPGEVAAELTATGLDSRTSSRQIVDFLAAHGAISIPEADGPMISETLSLDPFHQLNVSKLSMEAAIARLTRHVVGCEMDWVYRLHLDQQGETYASMYSGLLARLSPSGILEEAWELPGSAGAITDIGGQAFAEVASEVWRVPFGEEATALATGEAVGQTFVHGSLFVTRGKREIEVTDCLTGLQQNWTTARDVRAVYPAHDGVHVETTTTIAKAPTP